MSLLPLSHPFGPRPVYFTRGQSAWDNRLRSLIEFGLFKRSNPSRAESVMALTHFAGHSRFELSQMRSNGFVGSLRFMGADKSVKGESLSKGTYPSTFCERPRLSSSSLNFS
jgi:hypothetical protein